MMDALRTFLEQQPLLALFLVVGLGYALGGVNVRGFALGAGAVLFVGLAVGMLSPRAAPPALVGSLGLVLFVYGVGIQYGKQFFSGMASPFGVKANALVLLSHLAGIGVCWLGPAVFSVTPAAVAGLFLQKTDVPQRITDRQNVLFVGNVLNNYPPDEQTRELCRIATNMEEGDIVIVQVDEVEAAFIDVLQVKGQGDLKTLERVRWINTKTLEVQQPVPGSGLWRQIRVKPEVERMASRLIVCLANKVSTPELSQNNHRIHVQQDIGHVFRTFFRALPVEETLRIAVREALRRLPSEGCLKGFPVFYDDAKDAYGGALGSDPSPIVSEADVVHLGLPNPEAEKPPQVEFSEFKSGPRFGGEPNGATKLRRSIFTESMYKQQEKKPSKSREIGK